LHIIKTRMKKNIIITLLAAIVLSSCGQYSKLLKSKDYEYKYEAAKTYYAKGQYNKASTLLNELTMIFKGTDKAEESVYLLGMCYMNQKDYTTAATTFITYYTSYPSGRYAEIARYQAGKSLYLDTPEPRLDQTSTYKAIQELHLYLEEYPNSARKTEAEDMMFELQEKLVKKEYLASKLYYDLGLYMGNNYQSCIITAQNTLNDYPYTKQREELSVLILRAKYAIAENSVEEKKDERYRDAIDEYYAFKNEFPESKYVKEAEKIFKNSVKEVDIDGIKD